MKRRVQFKWMNAYWSCSPERWDELEKAASNGAAFDMGGCRVLCSRPQKFKILQDTVKRTENSWK